MNTPPNCQRVTDVACMCSRLALEYRKTGRRLQNLASCPSMKGVERRKHPVWLPVRARETSRLFLPKYVIL